MSRNGSGSHSIPNTMVAGAVITASAHNQNYSDVSAEITNSVAVDGQSTMTGQFKAAAGTVALPGITFGSDPDSGVYRIAANNLGIAANGAKVLDISATGLGVVGTILNGDGTVSLPGFSFTSDTDCGFYRIGANNIGFAIGGVKVLDFSANGILGVGAVAVGAIMEYGGSTAPTGWIFALGQNVNRATYPALFTVYGTTFGAGDGISTFGVPDEQGRVVAGRSSGTSRLTTTYFGASSGQNDTGVGSIGGAESQALTAAQLATHAHVVTDPGHLHISSSTTAFAGTTTGGAASGGGFTAIAGPSIAIHALTTTSSTTGITVANAGSGEAHNNVQPTIVMNKIIFTGVV